MTLAFVDSGSDETTVAIQQPELLHTYFERQAMLRPDHAAVECRGETLTYAQLDRLSNQIARHLRSRGVGTGSLVGICFEKSCRLYAALLGGWKPAPGS